jgi:N-acetyl-gamma-glutamyl-phosphate reductase
MVAVGVLGASGYTGAELLRICAAHPDFEVVHAAAHSSEGLGVRELFPSLAAAYPSMTFGGTDLEELTGCELVFSALPHGESAKLMPELLEKADHVVDLAADFRLRNAALYPEWYGEPHAAPDLLGEAAFGIPELFRENLKGAGLVAAAGCYVTAASLALAPFTRAGAIELTGIVVDAASGVTGAGRKATDITHFASVDSGFAAYGLLNHRHTPEIQQALGEGVSVLFTPHLAPMSRGILATCYARPAAGFELDTNAALELLGEFYAAEPFVQVVDAPPSTKATLGSNLALITARVDPRTGWLVVISALDNLVKGASGQAVQCANAVLGLDETSGLSLAGVYP